MKRRLLAALLALCASPSFAIVPLGGAVASSSENPLLLPLLSPTASIYTPLGSFSVPTSYTSVNIAGAITVCDPPTCSPAAMYTSGNYDDPTGSGANQSWSGIGAFVIPTLTGPPAWDGSNGTVSTVNFPPNQPASQTYNAGAVETATTTPTTGITSITFEALPSGVTANDNWYIFFQKASTGKGIERVAITGVSGNTLSFAALTGAGPFGTSAQIYQFAPLTPCGNASGMKITGDLIYGGNVDITCGVNYDTVSATVGWIFQSSGLSNSSWGNVWTVNPPPECTPSLSDGGTYPELCSKRYAGPMGLVPAAWQSLLGGPAYVVNALGSLSIIGTDMPWGFSFSTFNPATITSAGGEISPNFLQDYFNQGNINSAYVEQLNSRSFSGPFPLYAASFTGSISGTTLTETAISYGAISPGQVLTGAGVTSGTTVISGSGSTWTVSPSQTVPSETITGAAGPTSAYYPATLTGGNGSGPNGLTKATQVTLAVPSGNVVLVASLTKGSNTFCISSITSGTLSNSGIWYSASDDTTPGNLSNISYVDPAWDQGPGNPVGAGSCPGEGQYTFHDAAKGTSSADTLTLTPLGYFTPGEVAGYMWIRTSDGETRVGHLNTGTGSLTFPEASGGVGNVDPTSFAPLNCVSCTLSISIARMGDNLVSEYEQPLGTCYFVPNTRTLDCISMHEYGPPSVRDDACVGGASGSNEIPTPPDTKYYIRLQETLYDLRDLVNALNGVASDTNCPNPVGEIGIYAACPYAQREFEYAPDFAYESPNGCLTQSSSGWAYFDPTTNILYMTFKNSQYGEGIVYEFGVS